MRGTAFLFSALLSQGTKGDVHVYLKGTVPWEAIAGKTDRAPPGGLGRSVRQPDTHSAPLQVFQHRRGGLLHPGLQSGGDGAAVQLRIAEIVGVTSQLIPHVG